MGIAPVGVNIDEKDKTRQSSHSLRRKSSNRCLPLTMPYTVY